MPKLTPTGNQIIFDRLAQFEPSKYVFADVCKAVIMSIEAAIYLSGPQQGYYIMFDMTGVRLGHLSRLNLRLLNKFFTYIQVKPKCYHRFLSLEGFKWRWLWL